MSWLQDKEPECRTPDCAPVERVVVPRAHDIGAFEVRRALPAAGQRALGPFVFLDQMGPAVLTAERAMDVRPHPHIGLATVTWLLDGEIMHRDSLGHQQAIRPGELNWMTAGRGIVHSERTPEHLRGRDSPIFGMQAWVALPAAQQDSDPAFMHYGADALPVHEDEGVRAVVIAGSGWGLRSPVATLGEVFYADVALRPGATIAVPSEIAERGAYVLTGSIEIAGTRFSSGRLAVLRGDREISITAVETARLMLLGGPPLDGRRHLWWNFVSTSKDRMEQAKADWRDGRFGTVPGDEREFIPLPD